MKEAKAWKGVVAPQMDGFYMSNIASHSPCFGHVVQTSANTGFLLRSITHSDGKLTNKRKVFEAHFSFQTDFATCFNLVALGVSVQPCHQKATIANYLLHCLFIVTVNKCFYSKMQLN